MHPHRCSSFFLSCPQGQGKKKKQCLTLPFSIRKQKIPSIWVKNSPVVFSAGQFQNRNTISLSSVYRSQNNCLSFLRCEHRAREC